MNNSTSTSTYPPEALPVAFADFVMNFALSSHAVKFYLARFDPSIGDGDENRPTPVVQVVFTRDGFMNTFAFLERSINSLIKDGALSQDEVDAARAFYNK